MECNSLPVSVFVFLQEETSFKLLSFLLMISTHLYTLEIQRSLELTNSQIWCL